MSETKVLTGEVAEPLVNVFIRLPENARLELLVEGLRTQLKMEERKVQSIISRLQSSPAVQIGEQVAKSSADRAAADFRHVGFIVEMRSVLSLQAMTANQAWDGAYECPSCDSRVVLTELRQCPKCNVYVDKLSEEFLLRKKIAKEERRRAQSMMDKETESRTRKEKATSEALLRAKIREEIEDELGVERVKTSLFSGRPGLVYAGGLLLLAGGAFAGGMGVSSLLGPKQGAPAEQMQAMSQAERIDKLLQATKGMGTKLDGPSVGDTAELGEPAMDPRSDESLTNVAEQKQGKGRGLTVAQAVAASQTLAQPLMQFAGGPSKVPESGAVKPPYEITVPATLKPLLQAELARVLAELGHVQRAREVLKTAYAGPDAGRSADGVIQLKLAELEVEAFGVLGGPEGRVKAQLAAIGKSVAELPTPYWKTLALARLGEILGRAPRFSMENAQPYFQQASEAVKDVTPAEHFDAAVDVLTVSMARLRLESATELAGKGLWSHARARVGHIDAAYKKAAQGPAYNRLAALKYEGQYLLGSYGPANETLAQAMAYAQTLALSERLPALRAWASVLPAADPVAAAFSTLLAATRAQVEVLAVTPEKTLALGELALIYADAGQAEIFETLRQRATSMKGSTPDAPAELDSRLGVMGMLALARSANKKANFAAAEGYLRAVAEHIL